MDRDNLIYKIRDNFRKDANRILPFLGRSKEFIRAFDEENMPDEFKFHITEHPFAVFTNTRKSITYTLELYSSERQYYVIDTNDINTPIYLGNHVESINIIRMNIMDGQTENVYYLVTDHPY